MPATPAVEGALHVVDKSERPIISVSVPSILAGRTSSTLAGRTSSSQKFYTVPTTFLNAAWSAMTSEVQRPNHSLPTGGVTPTPCVGPHPP